METYVLTKDYKHLKAGDKTKSNIVCRDSGYVCHLWHDGTKPLAEDVSPITKLREKLKRTEATVVELKRLIGTDSSR